MQGEKWLKHPNHHLRCVKAFTHPPLILLFYKEFIVVDLESLASSNKGSCPQITMTTMLSLLSSLSVCLLILFHLLLHAQAYQSQCQLQKIDALEPLVKKSSEAGDTEIWDENNEQFECAGVVVIRHTIQPKGLLLPHYHNAPKLTYIVQGWGMYGAAIPGCPETYQSSQQQSPHEQGQSQEQSYKQGDKHQKVRLVRQGDIVATPVGILHWFYNDGQTPLVLVLILDTSNNENQLDDYPKTFYLGGNPQQQRQQGNQSYQLEFFAKNILGAFGDSMLSEALGVRPETARKLKGENDDRGNIVRVENGLQVIRPTRMQEEEQEKEEQQGRPNGLEESICNAKLRINIDNPSQADVYNPQGGRINRINSRNLPILRTFKLNAERGKLYQNALMVLHWNLNAHSVIYATGGSAHVQIVGNYQHPIFDGQLHKGQLLLVPQNFAVVKRAGDQGFEWISFKTNDVATINAMTGMNSALRAMPEEVLMIAFRISREEARRLKYNREEDELFPPRSESQQSAIA
ncbi:Glutelin type-b [Thalictrum thalictroides]|uniref:Glutelin type-b n=1 Tax=Thalictrum thalictroides TaxID=46969 RepID=A0A7J6UTJ3_THATH|nr:Glutelin type-b [Thalictrum thalictroides]